MSTHMNMSWFFFFKQKTAYEMRISDWSSDVCSSDLNVKFRFTMYSVPGGNKLDLSLGGDDELKEVELSRRQVTYSYRDGDAFVFLDDEDYTPYTPDADAVGQAAGYIVDDLSGCYVQNIDDLPVAVTLPQRVADDVVETPPALKGGPPTTRPEPRSEGVRM